MLALYGLVLPAAGWAQVRFVDAQLTAVPLAAGATAQIHFQLHNPGAAAASIEMGVSRPPLVDGVFPYIVSVQSDCPMPAAFESVTFTLVAGANLECRYQVSRRSEAAGDGRLVFNLIENGNSVQRKQFRVGDLTRLELSEQIERLPGSGLPGRVRIDITNAGPTAVGELAYGSCAYPGTSTAVATVVGGDCVAGGFSLCFTGGIETGFAVAGIPVGATRSCVLEWQPNAANPGINLILTSLQKAGTTAAPLENINPAADSVVVTGLQPVDVRQIPLWDSRGRWLLLVGLALAAAWRLRRC